MRIRAENLADVDVPLPGGGAAVPGEGEGVAHHVRLQDHVVASVGAAQYRRLRTILSDQSQLQYTMIDHYQGPFFGHSTGKSVSSSKFHR